MITDRPLVSMEAEHGVVGALFIKPDLIETIGAMLNAAERLYREILALAPDNLAYNTLHRATRCLGERGFALLTGRWRALQRITVSPSRIGELAQAALVLTRLENGQLRTSC